MIVPRRAGAAHAMGNFVPSLNSTSTRTERHCQRAGCGTRLRHGNPGPYCDPCRERLHPWVMPQLRTGKNYDACACGAQKSVTSMTCVTCYRDRQRARRRVDVDRRLKARADGLCADCCAVPHRPRHSLCIACSNKRYRKPAA